MNTVVAGLMLFSVLVPQKGWFAPDQPININVKAQGDINRHDPNLFAVGTNETDFGDADTVICTGISDASLLYSSIVATA